MGTLADYIQAFPQRGDKTALLYHTAFRTFQWRYRQLYVDVQKTASFLGELGVGRGDRVLIWAPDSPQWALVFLGCIYKGAVPVPADFGASREFLQAIARETQARALFRSRMRDAPDLELLDYVIDDLLFDIPHYPPQHSPADINQNDLAELLYTSGTTGTPKGVMLTHGNITANLKGIEEAIEIGPEHVLVSLLPLSHIFEQSVTFWSSLSHGATVIFLQLLKASELFKALRRYPVTALTVVPELLRLMEQRARRQAKSRLGPQVFERLLQAADQMPRWMRRLVFYQTHSQIGRRFRFFVVGGAPLDEELRRFWTRLGFLVLQGYGLTEASPVVTANRPDAMRPGSVGLPLPGVEVAIAEDGEVLVRGMNVSPGYFQRPEETRDTFRSGWLHTGDLGHLDGDGFLFLRGRKKDLIVTPTGLNVYPQDVESAFRDVPGVRDVAVLEFRGRIHAALLPEPGTDAQRAVERANARLAEFQRVQDYTVWPDTDFPRTTTRKPKKHEILAALESMAKEPERRPSEVAQREEAPGGVVRIIARVADNPASAVKPQARLGPDLGLDSVGRIELVMALEEELHTEIAEEAITDETTVRDVERLLHEGGRQERLRFARWGLWPPIRVFRKAFQGLMLFSLYSPVVRQRVEGLENLAELGGPVIFAPNHTSHLDTAAVLKALPSRFRDRLAVAIFAEFFEVPSGRLDRRLLKKLAFMGLTLGFNVYPLPRTSGFRQSLAYTGELLDKGWSILVYPEGRLTDTGQIYPFREGIGIMAREMLVPVVPVRIEGLFDALPLDRRIPHRGRAVIRFGEPHYPGKESYEEFTRRLEKAVRRLAA